MSPDGLDWLRSDPAGFASCKTDRRSGWNFLPVLLGIYASDAVELLDDRATSSGPNHFDRQATHPIAFGPLYGRLVPPYNETVRLAERLTDIDPRKECAKAFGGQA
jgi:hypothetical protein